MALRPFRSPRAGEPVLERRGRPRAAGHRAADGIAKPTFTVRAQLQVPKTVAIDTLRRELGNLAQELMLDLNLGD